LTNRKRGIVDYFSGGTFGTFEYVAMISFAAASPSLFGE
jgi:hypothetical protein